MRACRRLPGQDACERFFDDVRVPRNLVSDRCLQHFGGYGYMQEYPIARIFVDARIQKVYGSTNEIMKEIIARSL